MVCLQFRQKMPMREKISAFAVKSKNWKKVLGNVNKQLRGEEWKRLSGDVDIHGTKKITIGGVRVYESMIEHILHKTSIPISGKLLDFYSD